MPDRSELEGAILHEVGHAVGSQPDHQRPSLTTTTATASSGITSIVAGDGSELLVEFRPK
jgi:hypothetical protein